MSDTVFRASWRSIVGVALATTMSAAAAMYAIGAAFGWWGGSSCALAVCGAEDIGWAWFILGVVLACVTGLFALLATQTVLDRTIMNDVALWPSRRHGAVDWATIDRFELSRTQGDTAHVDVVVSTGQPVRLRGVTVTTGEAGAMSVDEFRSAVARFTDRSIPVERNRAAD